MKNVQDIANGRGFIYLTQPNGTTILANLPNNADGYRQARMAGLVSSALTGEVLAHAEVQFTATPAGDISAITVNGINQLSGTVAATAGDPAATVLDLRDNINAFKPASGADYTAFALGDTLQLVVEPGKGTSVNGHLVAVTADAGITTSPASPRVYGGSDPTEIFDGAFGYRFFLDADYGAGDVSGEGTAVEGDLSNAIEITEFLVERGLQSKLDTTSSTLANDTLSVDRTMSVMTIDVDTEGGAGTDNLKTIEASNWAFGDIIILRAVNSSRVTTINNTTGAGENIYLQTSASFALGDITRLLALQYYNDGGTAKWIEVFRNPVLADTTISVANMRSVGIPQPVSGTATTTLATTGGTVTLTPGTDKGYQILLGSGSLSSNWTITAGGSPKDRETWVIDYRGTFTAAGNTLTIFGKQLTDNMLSQGKVMVIATYDSTATAYRAELFVSAETTGWIEGSMIQNTTITNDKIVNNTITNAKLATPPPTTYAKEIFTVPVSFESGETGSFKIKLNYAGTIDSIYGNVMKVLGGGDNGVVTFTTAGGAIPETITIPASSPADTEVEITPSANYTFAADETIEFTVSKATPGGKAMVTLRITRTS